jgi:hypothetical protein
MELHQLTTEQACEKLAELQVGVQAGLIPKQAGLGQMLRRYGGRTLDTLTDPANLPATAAVAGGLGGGALGGLSGYFGEQDPRDRERKTLSRALGGALSGAALGLGGGLAYQSFRGLKPKTQPGGVKPPGDRPFKLPRDPQGKLLPLGPNATPGQTRAWFKAFQTEHGPQQPGYPAQAVGQGLDIAKSPTGARALSGAAVGKGLARFSPVTQKEIQTAIRSGSVAGLGDEAAEELANLLQKNQALLDQPLYKRLWSGLKNRELSGLRSRSDLATFMRRGDQPGATRGTLDEIVRMHASKGSPLLEDETMAQLKSVTPQRIRDVIRKGAPGTPAMRSQGTFFGSPTRFAGLKGGLLATALPWILGGIKPTSRQPGLPGTEQAARRLAQQYGGTQP